MDIHIIAVGHAKAGPERELFEHYLSRITAQGRQAGIGAIDLHEVAEPKRLPSAQRKAAEGQRLLDALPAKTHIVVLDEHGKQIASGAFAERMRSWQDGGQNIAFLIGGADGLSDEVLSKAHERLALGPMTWPHMLARVLVAEQLYRAITLLTGHPYHRA